MIKLVAFDLDGTIADTIPMCIEAFKQAVSPYASKILSEDDIVKTFGLKDRKSTRLNSSHIEESRMPSSA